MISVCIATYNGELYLKKQLSSILPQLKEEDEIIVSDDGSTDSTISIVNSFNDSRIKIVEGPEKGLISNFENALSYAQGDYIFLSDQDDEWCHNKVNKVLHAFSNADCIISNCNIVDENSLELECSFYKCNKTKENKYYNLLARNGYLGCCMAFNRKILKKALPFPKHIPMHDIWIGNVAAFYGTVKFIPESLIHYRRHGNNASVAGEKSIYSLKSRFNFRYYIIAGLIKKMF